MHTLRRATLRTFLTRPFSLPILLISRSYFTRGAEIEQISRWFGAEPGQAPHEIADLLQQPSQAVLGGRRVIHPSVEQYLEFLHAKRFTARTLNVVRYDLTRLIRWRESQQRTFDPPLLRYDDLHNWRMARRRDDGAVFATINRGLASLRGYCQWATACHLLVENPTIGFG